MQAIARCAVDAASANHLVRTRDDAAEARGPTTKKSKTEVFGAEDSSTPVVLKFSP